MASGTTLDISDRNAAIFFDSSLAEWYLHQPLHTAEAIILIRWRDAYAGKSVLDLGVGSGRTTRYIAPFAASYTGIDISEQMLDVARREAPDARFLKLDLRELDQLAKGGYDFIFGPFNVFGALDHEPRCDAIAACRQLLSPDGMLIFSAHNRRHVAAGRPPRAPGGRGLLRNLLDVRHYVVAMANYLRLRKLRREEADYALFNDISHAWQGVFYYVTREAQVSMLKQAGFDTIAVIGEDGKTLAADAPDQNHGSIHFVCKKTKA